MILQRDTKSQVSVQWKWLMSTYYKLVQRKEFKMILQVGSIICGLVHLRRVEP